MRMIYKYPFPVDDLIVIGTHRSAELLSVQDQRGMLCFWFLVDTDEPLTNYRYRVYGTGHQIDVPALLLTHRATVQQLDGAWVWHVFEDRT